MLRYLSRRAVLFLLRGVGSTCRRQAVLFDTEINPMRDAGGGRGPRCLAAWRSVDHAGGAAAPGARGGGAAAVGGVEGLASAARGGTAGDPPTRGCGRRLMALTLGKSARRSG